MSRSWGKLALVCLALPSVAVAQPRGVVNDALMRYSFTTEVDGFLRDTSGNGFHAMSMEEPSFIANPEVIGRAMHFEESDAVLLPDEAIDAVADLSQGSIYVRFSFDDVLDNVNILPVAYLGIDDADEPDTLLTIEIGHGDATNQKLYFTLVVKGELALCFDTAINLTPNDVHAFVATVGPDGNTGYLDGEELVGRHYNAGDASTSAFVADLPNRALTLFSVGYGKTSDGYSPDFVHFRGLVDELQIYDRPLTTKEATYLTALAPPR